MPTQPVNANPAPRAPRRAAGWGMVFLNWALPGVGFILAGRKTRGLIQMGLVFVTFAIGLLLRGGVIWSWGQDASFNLVNIITYIIQMGAGLPAIVSMVAHLNGYAPLGGVPPHGYFELGSFYLVVAGALNYFATCNLYDRLVKPTGHFEVQETGGAGI